MGRRSMGIERLLICPLFEDSEVILKKSDVVVQRGTNHAWENRSDSVTRMAFFHVNAEFNQELLGKLPEPLELLR